MAKPNELLQEILEKENVSLVDMQTGERTKGKEKDVEEKDVSEKEEIVDKKEEPLKEEKAEEKEEIKEEPIEETAKEEEPKEKEVEPEKIIEEKETEFLTKINTEFGTEAKTVEDVVEKFKEVVKVTDVVKELEGKLQDLIERNKELTNLYDPKEIFVNDNEYKRQQLLKKFPDYDPSVITKVINVDIDKLSPLDVIKYGMLLVDSDIYKNDGDAKEVMADKYGIEANESFDEIEDNLTKNKILKDAKQTKKLFQDLKEGSKEEKSFDILAERDTKRKEAEDSHRKLKDNWKPIIEKISQEIGDISIAGKDEAGDYSFVFKIDKDFKEGVKGKSEALADNFATTGIQSDEKGIAFIKTDLADYYSRTNFDKIIQAAISFGGTRQAEQRIKKNDNAKPLDKESDAPPTLDKEEGRLQRIKERALKVLY